MNKTWKQWWSDYAHGYYHHMIERLQAKIDKYKLEHRIRYPLCTHCREDIT